MSRKIYVYTCVLFILLIGLSALSAENVTSSDNTDTTATVSADTTSSAAISNDVPVKYMDDTTRNDDVEYNNHTLKSQDKNLKSKSPMQISVDDYTCDVDDVIHVTTHMNPAGVTEGVLMYSIDDDLIGTCSLLNVGNQLDIDTYGYEPGEHILSVDYTASLNYESTSASSSLTIYQPLSITASKNNLLLNSTRLNDSLFLSCDNTSCHTGDMELYIDDILNKTFTDIDYDGFELRLDHYQFRNKNNTYTWTLKFMPDDSYVRVNDLTGSLRVNFMPRNYVINMEAEDVTCNYGDTVTLNVSFIDSHSGDLLYVNDGVIMYFVDDELVATHNLSYTETSYTFNTSYLRPGIYNLVYNYVASMIYEPVDIHKTLTINHEYTINANTSHVSYNHRNKDADVIILSCNDTLGFGDIEIYIDNRLTDTISDVDYDNLEVVLDEDTTGITEDGNYTYTLKFKPYYDNIQVNDITGTIEATGFKKDLQINTQPVTAHVGDVVDIPVIFNDTVSDGTLTVSYGESTDNTITVDSNTQSISFDTIGYLQGEYELKIEYTNGSQYYDTQTTTTLYLYQPTTLTVAEDEYNIVLGKNNIYEIEFTTSLDEFDDVIWGSIDVYIDDTIIDTLIIDDDTGNTAVLILDDYNMEDLTPGLHTLQAVFTSDDPYIETSTATATLNIQGEVIIELTENITAMTGQAITIPSNVSFNGHKITTGILNYYIDDTLIATQTINSQNTNYTINTNNYNPNIYELRVEYTDANGVYPSNTNTTDLIIRSDAYITTRILNNTVRNTTIEITLKDSRDNPINGLINITLPDGSRQLNIPVTGGVATLTLTNQNPGTNTITISYPESVLYNAKTTRVVVDVVKLNSTTTASITNTSSQNTTIHVQVTDEKTGQTITTGTIQIINTANNEIVGQATLNGQEEVTITTTLKNQGLYNLRVDYTGNDIYNTSNTILENVEVTGRLSQLQLNTLNDTLDNTTITIQTIDPVTNTPILNAPVTITLPNGDVINTNTGASGIVTQKLDLPVGQNTITIDYPGNEHYNKTNIEYTVNVAPRASTITAVVTNKTIRNTTLQVTVTDSETGNPVTRGSITIIDTTTGQTVATAQLTDENPVTITTDINAARAYNLEVLFNNNVNYTPSSTTIEDIVVSKRASQTQITVNSDVYEDSKITIKVTDPVTTTPIANAPITITLPNEETINTNTDQDGHLTAYYNNNKIATSNNTTSIIIPAKYNLEEINLTYTGVDDYNDSSIQFRLMADKISSRTYSSYISATKNTNVNIYPRITSNTPYLYGKINIYIDNNLVKTIDVEKDNIYISTNGTSTTIGDTLDLSGYDDGVYNLTFEVDENNVFSGSFYSTTLTISKVNTYIYASNRTIYVGDTSNLYAYVYANNKDTVNAGQMSFSIDGQLIGTEYVSNNTASIEYPVPSTLSMGKHTLIVTYEGDDNYNTSSKEATLTLAKTTTTTTLRTWTVENEKIILNTQTRAYNKTIDTGNITAYIDNKQVATSKLTNNTANITLPDTITTDTTYSLRLVYGGTDLLNSSTYESSKFIFNKKNTTIRLYPYLRSNGTITLTGYVYSDNYAKVDAGEIIFTINNQIIARANVENNKANTTYDMSNYDAANYTLKATYNGSKLFNKSINSTTVTKTPYYHTIYMNIHNKSLSVKRGSSTDINATLTCYSRNITEDINATINLNATWGTVVYTQDVTFHNGVLNTKLSIPRDFELFTFEGREITRYTLTINTLQSKNFKETSQSATVNIGEYTKLYQKTLWGYKNANVTFNSTLQDADGKQVTTNTTAKIDIFTADNHKITSIDTKIINGKLEYTYKIPAALTDNTYTVNITAHSNNDYASSYKTVNMTLNNRRTYITASNIQSYIDSNIILNGTIMDSITRSKANTNTQVDILIDNKKIATVNLTKGTFKYTLKNNYTKGQHNITYNYKGDDIYNTTNRSVNFTSNKNALRIAATPITTKIGNLINIKANITNTTGNIVKESLKADILLNGKTVATGIDITNGILSYNYTIPQGTQSNSRITINIYESSKYNPRNATTTLKINKDYQFINLEKTIITTSKGSKININGNITDKNRKPVTDTKLNIKIAGVDIANITSSNGKFNYEYTTTQNKGTYDILITAQETDNYLYNAKHMSLKVTS